MPRVPAWTLGHVGYTDGCEAHTRFSAKGTAEQLPVDRMPEPISKFLQYWESRRAGAGMPEGAAIDPVDIPLLLPHLMLWSTTFSRGRLEFVCRLAGSEVEGPRRTKLAGQTLEELNGSNSARARSEFEFVAHHGMLHYVERTADWIERPFLYYCRLLLPLARSDAAHGGLVSVLTFEGP